MSGGVSEVSGQGSAPHTVVLPLGWDLYWSTAAAPPFALLVAAVVASYRSLEGSMHVVLIGATSSSAARSALSKTRRGVLHFDLVSPSPSASAGLSGDRLQPALNSSHAACTKASVRWSCLVMAHSRPRFMCVCHW